MVFSPPRWPALAIAWARQAYQLHAANQSVRKGNLDARLAAAIVFDGAQELGLLLLGSRGPSRPIPYAHGRGFKRRRVLAQKSGACFPTYGLALSRLRRATATHAPGATGAVPETLLERVFDHDD